MSHALSPQGQILLRILVEHIKQPGVSVQRPETLIGYGEALEKLSLPANAPRADTDGRTLQLNGLNDLARWINQHPKKLPRITGVIISRSEYDGVDGTRRPKNVPSVGYFKEYKRKADDWPWWQQEVEDSIAFDWSPYLSAQPEPAPKAKSTNAAFLEQLRPTEPLRAYDLLRKAGLVTEVPEKDVETRLASHRTYLSRWAFIEGNLIVLCLHYHDMQEADGIIFQDLNYRTNRPEHRGWTAIQKERAWSMDRTFVTANKTGSNIKIIVVDGHTAVDGSAIIERRLLDPEPWHVASYDSKDGWCRLQRGPRPTPPETFSSDEVKSAGTYAEGALGAITTKTRERSACLRDLARDYFAAKSDEKRLHCAVCEWAPPLSLALSGPIVEIHHGLGIGEYPADGRALTFEEAIQHLTPLCPNCHRISHAKPGGGTFTLDELKRGVRSSVSTTAV